MSNVGYNTNLAAEFHVLSVLHRLGVDATLTLGNKKSVDIAVIKGAGRSITVDVKGPSITSRRSSQGIFSFSSATSARYLTRKFHPTCGWFRRRR